MKMALIAAACALAACGGSSGPANQFAATLNSANETPAPPSPNPSASGTAAYNVLDGGTAVSYTVTWSGMSTKPSAGHIHVGSSTEAGGVVVPFTIPGNATTSGTITGTFDATNVRAGTTPSQTITANDMTSMLAAMRAGNTYTNLHTTANPNGEIRGQNH
jgi:CHRD domain